MFVRSVALLPQEEHFDALTDSTLESVRALKRSSSQTLLDLSWQFLTYTPLPPPPTTTTFSLSHDARNLNSSERCRRDSQIPCKEKLHKRSAEREQPADHRRCYTGLLEATSFAGSTLNLIKATLRRYIYPLKRGGFDFYSLTRVINHQHHFGAIIRNTKKRFSLLSSVDVIFPPRTK